MEATFLSSIDSAVNYWFSGRHLVVVVENWGGERVVGLYKYGTAIGERAGSARIYLRRRGCASTSN